MGDPDYDQYDSTRDPHRSGGIGCGLIIIAIIACIIYPPLGIPVGIVLAIIILWKPIAVLAIGIGGGLGWLLKKIWESSSDTIDRSYSDPPYGRPSSRLSKIYPTPDTQTSQAVKPEPERRIQPQSRPKLTCPHCKGPARDMSSGYAKCLACGRIFKYEEPETIRKGSTCPHCSGDIRPLPGIEWGKCKTCGRFFKFVD